MLGGIWMDYVRELRKLVGHRPLILPGSVVLIINENNGRDGKNNVY
jgi:hypothetical protein